MNVVKERQNLNNGSWRFAKLCFRKLIYVIFPMKMQYFHAVQTNFVVIFGGFFQHIRWFLKLMRIIIVTMKVRVN